MTRVFIPTAGTGSRLYPLTKYLNKSLISVNNKPVISHIIEQYPDNTQFVIALGYRGDLVKQFLELVYPNKTFYFVTINKFIGEGSGLGHTLLMCKNYLQEPFIFNSCDTLVRNSIPDPSENWIGYSEFPGLTEYRTIKIKHNKVIELSEKSSDYIQYCKAYIGLSGICDYEHFWKSMEEGGNEAIIKGESYGLFNLIYKGITAHKFKWCDTGNIRGLQMTRDLYQSSNSPNILDKPDEAIWFVNNKVIKFSNNTKFVENRVKRANLLEGYVPKILDSRPNMYSYRKVKGEILSKIITIPLFEDLLEHGKDFWNVSYSPIVNLSDKCLNFYKNKTEERIQMFYKIHNIEDKEEIINNIFTPKLKSLLDEIDWRWISDGIPGKFHGDFHFENILYSDISNRFTFLDWRQDFAGELWIGDIYYDFAKLNHGLIICHELIVKNMFNININDDNITFDFYRKQILVECENYFKKWIEKNGYDYKKVRILTALIFLNIAPLHHDPYSKLLYYLGKSMLYEELKTI